MKLSVVIVNYNVRHFLAQCLDSVIRATAGMEAEVWVVDNASTDGSVAYARNFFPQVHYIENTENAGFASANNQAIRQARGEYVLLLNPDTLVGEDVLHGCVDFLDAHPEAGATGTMMLNRNGSFAYESRRGIPTPATSFYKISGLCALFPRSRRFGKYYLRYLNKEEENPIEVISGAFFMARRTALEQVGLMSEDYFMYGEDIDLSYSLLQAGWHNWYQPLPILHYKGESTQKTSFRYVHSFYNAMLIFFDRHFSRRYRLLGLLVRMAVVGRGAFEMARQQTLRVARSRKKVHPSVRRLLFLGSDKAWQLLLPVCERAQIEARRIATPDEVADITRARTYNYIAFQTGDGGTAYSVVLRELRNLYQQGTDLHLGTFDLRTKALILPDEICL